MSALQVAEDLVDSVLVVDDSRVNRRLLKGILAREGFDVHEAADGAEGITRAVEEPPGLILLDIDMPVLDGFSVCSTLKDDPRTADVPIVFLSSMDQAAQKVRGLELGAADYVTKPFDRGEVLERVKTQLRLSRLTRSLQDANKELVRQRGQLETDLRAAAEIQRSLLPVTTGATGPLDIAWRYEPCASIGGDIFNTLNLGDDVTAIYMADVAGHGVSSALVSISISHQLAGGWLRDQEGHGTAVVPSEVLRRLDLLYPIERFDRFFTITYLLFDAGSSRLRFSSAGHPPPLLLRAGGGIERLEEGGPMIGLGAELAFDEGSVMLEPGDRIAIYTDGVMEAPGAEGEMFGIEGLERVLAESRDDTPQEACDRLAAHLTERGGSLSAHDDVSYMIVDRREG